MKKKDNDTKYVPSEYKPLDPIDREKFSEEEIEFIRGEVKKQEKRVKGLNILSVIWTFVSTVYAISSTCVLIARRWVDSKISYVLIGILVLYVGIFIGVAIAAFASPKDGKKSMKGVKAALKFLKPVMSIVLVALAVTELIAIAEESISIPKIAFMVVTMLVAFLQLVLRVVLLLEKTRTKRIAKGFQVRMEHFVDGQKQKKDFFNKIKEKKYRPKD